MIPSAFLSLLLGGKTTESLAGLYKTPTNQIVPKGILKPFRWLGQAR